MNERERSFVYRAVKDAKDAVEKYVDDRLAHMIEMVIADRIIGACGYCGGYIVVGVDRKTMADQFKPCACRKCGARPVTIQMQERRKEPRP